MTYEKKAKRILKAIDNSKVPTSYMEIHRERLNMSIADELKKIDKEEYNNEVKEKLIQAIKDDLSKTFDDGIEADSVELSKADCYSAGIERAIEIIREF